MATVKIYRHTGTTPDTTDITDINTRLKADDSHSTAGTSNPIRVPTTGTNYSYWATMRLNVTANATNDTINNMKFYTDGTNSLGTGVGMDVALASAYAQAVGTEGTSGSALSNHTHLRTSVTGAFNYDSGSPLDIDATVTGTTGTGEIGDYVLLQVTVADTAGAGASTTETCSYQYDLS